MQRQFKFHPSRYLAAVMIAAHCTAIMALLPLTLPVWAKAALSVLVSFSLAYHLWRDAWLSAPYSCVGLVLDGDQVALTTRGCGQLAGQVLRESLVTPHLTVLSILPQGARLARNVLILPDSLDAESFRQLRVWLRWGTLRNSNRSHEAAI